MIDTIVVLDTESTGLDPAEGAALLEVAWVALARSGDTWSYADHYTTYVEHVGDVPPVARGVHHIGPADVAPGAPGCQPLPAVLHSLLAAEQPALRYCAHNAAHDQRFLPELSPTPWICTLKCAQHLWPEAPDHKAQTLRYWLGAEPPAAFLQGLGAHRALYDTACTAWTLLRMLETHTAEELELLTRAPVLLTTCRFGKHRGQPWSEVPTDYLRWMRFKSDLCVEDADLRHTVDHHLTARR